MRYSQLLINCIIYVTYVSATNILFLYEVPSPSHGIWNGALTKGLADKGYNVTIGGPDSYIFKQTENHHFITFEGVANSTKDIKMETFLDLGELSQMQGFSEFTYVICRATYNSKGMVQLWNYPEDFKFDLIIIDLTTGPCMYPLIKRFKYPPTIGVSAFLLPPYLSNKFGNDLHPSYLPYFHTRYPDNMSFGERTWNFILTQLDAFLKQTVEMNQIEEMAKQRFKMDFDFKKLERSISLLFSNHNPLLDYPQPLTPNIIPVGGLHVRPANKLNEDLTTIANNASRGLVIVSLGSNLKSEDLDLEKRMAMAEAFSRLEMTVMWKYGGIDPDFEMPENVITSKWLPQSDMLAHPNVKLLVTHGGALSTQEAAYHGIPIVGIPFLADQNANVRKMIDKGVGLGVDARTLTADILHGAMMEVLNNPLFSKNMKDLSKRLKDVSQSPLGRAIFWAEYAMRHNGTHFLDPKSRDMPYFIATSVDVILFLAAVAISIVFTTLVITLLVIKRLCTNSKKQKLASKKVKKQ